jgi:hypothetical protein
LSHFNKLSRFWAAFFTSFLQNFQFWGRFFYQPSSTNFFSQLILNPVWDVGLTMNPKKDPKKTKKTKNMGKSAFDYH